MNMEFKREMPTDRMIRELYPVSDTMTRVKRENDEKIRAVFTGESDRFVLLIGPCSADREDAVLDYVLRLRRVQEKVKDKLLIVPRIYTQKPRSTGEGYMGMLHQPNPNGSPDLLRGLIAVRRLHIRVLEESGFSGADEMLYPENYPYLADCLSYTAVGARSVENQLHRLAASGLDIPVGMKNPTGGDLNVMMNSVTAAQHAHAFVFSGWEVQSRGNPLAHAILRGFSDKEGRSVSNCHEAEMEKVLALYEQKKLKNPALVIDTNHANSGKRWDRQPEIAAGILHLRRERPDLGNLVKGLMIESYLEDGSQPPDGGIYGKSITDPCLGWEKTEKLIYELAENL